MSLRGGWGGWYPPRAPKRPAPAHGIRVRNAGTTWWGERWIEALERLSGDYFNRLSRGRTYAHAGRVHDLQVTGGRVVARVTGTRATPYKVRLRVSALSDGVWRGAIREMASQAIFSAQLLSGIMPLEIEEAFRRAGGSLFPLAAGNLDTECSCPDWANPCKHVAAVHYVLGEAFDRDPFLLFELRGRKKEDVLRALRELRAKRAPRVGERVDGRRVSVTARAGGRRPASSDVGTASVGDDELVPGVSLAGMKPSDYERPRGSLGSMRFHFEDPIVPAAILQQLGTPNSWSLRESMRDVLGPAYQAAAALAREIALSWDPEKPGASEEESKAPGPTAASRSRGGSIRRGRPEAGRRQG